MARKWIYVAKRAEASLSFNGSQERMPVLMAAEHTQDRNILPVRHIDDQMVLMGMDTDRRIEFCAFASHRWYELTNSNTCVSS